MGYRPAILPPPPRGNPELNSLYQALTQEFKNLAMELAKDKFLHLVSQNVAVDNPRVGMVAYADGTNWNPGYGAGIYAYDGAGWVPLGKTTAVLATTAATSGTQVNFASISQLYDDLLFEFVFLSHNDAGNQNLQLRLSTDNGSTFETVNANVLNDAATINSAASTFVLGAATFAGARTVHGRIVIPNYAAAAFRVVHGQLLQHDGAGAGAGALFGIQTTAQNVDYVRFQWSAGSFDNASGSIRMSGIRHG